MNRATVQATTLALGEAGVMILGAPGAGKTTLALSLVAAWRADGRFARLVADDGVLVERFGSRLVARAPATTAGCAEVRGHGIVRLAHLAAVRVSLVVDLVPRNHLVRMPEPSTCEILGVPVPRVAAETCNTLAASATIGFVLSANRLTDAATEGQRSATALTPGRGLGADGGCVRGDDR